MKRKKKSTFRESINPTRERFFGLDRGQKQGFFLIILSAIIWLFRPFQECKWYEIGCNAGGFVTSPIILIICGGLLIFGIIKLVRVM